MLRISVLTLAMAGVAGLSTPALAAEAQGSNAKMLREVARCNASASAEDQLTCRTIEREVLSTRSALTCGTAVQWQAYAHHEQRQRALLAEASGLRRAN
ncbi:hypothetical protein [Novosphingobium sp. BW1]|uniref:hypothetical protein n=1 Tax=Novosphingobium sp. BW1 TaxID=2592621 RepID=UPI0011DECA0A|nr:hypothetical protein [Novosphingobium sp. BW1]TYC93553.1 hypothetical protein FMM79_01245 [Novosphingobium sp. BW1]